MVSRALGRPCVVGIGETTLRAGQSGTVDGACGLVYAGSLALESPREAEDGNLLRLIGWARDRTQIKVLWPSEAKDP